jgi:hypothetical protein
MAAGGAIVVDVGTGTELGDAAQLVRAPQRRRRATTHHRRRQSGVAESRERVVESVRQTGELVVLLADGLAHVAGIESEAGERQSIFRLDAPREPQSVLERRDAHAMHSEVELHVRSDGALRGAGRRADIGDGPIAVEGDGQCRAGRQRSKTGRARCSHRWIRQQKIIADGRHHLGLERRSAGESPRAEPQLRLRDVYGLVRLYVRSECEAVRRRVLRGARQISVESMEIDNCRRGLDRSRGARGCGHVRKLEGATGARQPWH